MSSANSEAVRWQGPELINPDQASLAELEPEAIREAAYAEGLALGLKEGEKQGKAKFAASIATLDALLESIQEPIRKMDDDLAKALSLLVAKIAAHLVRGQLSVDESMLIERFRAVANSLPKSDAIPTLFISPSDYQIVSHYFESTEEIDRKDTWELEMNPDLEPGDCRMVSGDSAIEALLLKEAEEMVLAANKKRVSEDG
jgi:flagellar assembly protein FliH